MGFTPPLRYDSAMAFFITLEGGEGGGKSTQADLLARALEAQGRAVVTTREPGGTPLGKKIREILLSGRNHGLAPASELLLYAADRAQHVREVIRPALDQGKIVLSDRFQDSTTVYQGIGRGLNPTWLDLLSEMATEGLKPDLTIILDLDPAIGLKRSHARLQSENSSEDRFEKEALEFHQKVRRGFLDLAGKEPGRFVVVDATPAPMEIHEKILKVVQMRLLKK